jgi:hypothetical protein
MNTIGRWQDGDGSSDDTVSSRPSHRVSHERTRRQRVTIGNINAACDEFFRSRGMLKQASAYPRLKSQPGTELKPTD